MNRARIGGIGCLLLATLLAGCSSQPPRALGPAIADAPTAAEVQSDPQAFLGRQVRWGGEIIALRNADGHSDVEVFGRPLYDDGEPQHEGGQGVRFIARVPRFLDPIEYTAGKRLSVRGRLLEPMNRPVGEYDYRYPVVAVEGLHLWPAYQEPVDRPWAYDPYYYDPWWPYGPFRPYSRWPYHRW